ncbi:immunoglobulin-like domain-containing protein [Cohnella cholangitidis]|uniref:SbsA Ig-like domain-containing protein n=1 Tax=Cohnella cholangitidis TaxID=2598458 RepID=A0A7G5BZD9_9BACL|nr:immunoglobulin-like domain-containing protein [Cohnella cholangitidis]QMV42323.1 hypothetical protein FPL14_14810 [Cohnella cholangitidis]
MEGNVTIAAADVTLRNMTIMGDLIIDKSVGDGDVTINKVNVKGDAIVQGGGEDSVHFVDSILATIIADKESGTVRIVVEGKSSVETVTVLSNAIIEILDTAGISLVELASHLPPGANVELHGKFNKVDVNAASIKVEIPQGSIEHMHVGSAAGGTSINVGKDAAIIKLVLDAVVKLLGQGKIKSATVNAGAKGTTFEKQPEKMEGAGASAMPLSAGGGSGGGGSGGGPAPTTPTAFTVTFDLNGAAGTNPTAQGGASGTTLPVNPTRAGYAFIGWATASSATTADFTSTTAVTRAITVYAVWQEVTLAHNVTGDAKTFIPLIEGYEPGTQKTATVTVTATGANTNVTATLSGTNANSFVLTENMTDLANDATGTFTVKAMDGLTAGTYTATVTITSIEFTAGRTFTVIQEVLDATATPLEAATAAVVVAEESLAQEDVEAAQVLVTALADGQDKDALQNRLDAVQDEIDATAAVATAESTKEQADVDAALVLVTALADSQAKTNLLARLAAVQVVIDKAAAQVVIALIANLNVESETLNLEVGAAKLAYIALTPSQKALVTNLSILEAAEEIVNFRVAAAYVENTIDILTGLDNQTPEFVQYAVWAREGYEALLQEQQALVRNYNTLLAAEAAITEQMEDAKTDLDDADLLNGNSALNNITANLTLPTSGSNGTTISWTSNNGVIAVDGTVIRPVNGSGDYDVELTATISKGTVKAKVSVTKIFNVTVKELPDTTALTLLSFTPADSALDVAIDANLVLTFSKNVTAVAGKNIVIFNTDNDTVVATIAANDTTQVTVNNKIVTINPASDLANRTRYYVFVAEGAFKDAANNTYTGIDDVETWNFRTVAVAATGLTVTATDDDANSDHTRITIAETAGSGNSFMYKIRNTDPDSPYVGDEIATDDFDWMSITSGASIQVSNGFYVLVVEVNVDRLIVRYGKTQAIVEAD